MMTVYSMHRSRAARVLAPLALLLALGTSSAASTVRIQSGVSGIHYGIAPVSAQACKAGSTGNWIEADGVAIESGEQRKMSLSFSTPLVTDTFHAAMNLAGWRDLALIEFQDRDGAWHKVWEGRMDAPAPGFSQELCVEHRLPQKQAMQALRFSFRKGPGEIDVNHAALLGH
jgi:hypothetical protein